ncbi:hypothetical protein DACRYDRAFT_116899 [Dacryopinax primogenitus]|uniref:Uncharacterized protein n=1 Tax=Dacryopinax primogenitus (strain DJM 731) TaxID=1858805 RepID=M5G5J9_DACPD|nr:uncharacterized protein DACRYDRAFT_116899 [Dacryopinax primogenitus]EJU01082.1 hypothetical protein DACRYDRAFT_116899 [Dacryopinax primogenitus]
MSLTLQSLQLHTQTPQDAPPMLATLNLLYPSSSTSLASSFSPETLTLHPPASLPPPAAATQLRGLVLAAQKVASQAIIGSVLAGGGSESDEYGDIGLWIPSPDSTTLGAQEIGQELVKQLQLTVWSGAELTPRPPSLPLPWETIPAPVSKPLLEGLAQLQEPVSFTLQLDGAEGDTPVVLLGKMEGGWGGLIAAGVWS